MVWIARQLDMRYPETLPEEEMVVETIEKPAARELNEKLGANEGLRGSYEETGRERRVPTVISTTPKRKYHKRIKQVIKSAKRGGCREPNLQEDSD